MTSQCITGRWHSLLLMASLSTPLYGQESGGLFDPGATVPATVYESVFPDSSAQRDLDAPQYPWKELYHPDGTFIRESTFDGTGMSSDMMSSDDMTHEHMDHGDGMTMSSDSSDSRGVVKKIYADDGKVKMKHGPIEKLDMPGMTMIFYVKDPALLNELTVGDEVGFDVELDGSTFYIIRFEQ